MILQNYPWKLILDQAWRQHELPLWNPYEMAGLPYLATAQTGVLYPFTALFLVFGPLRAYGWYSALHQFLAASLTYLLVRRLGLGRLGSAVAGIAFAFCFFLTVSYIWPMVLGSAVWLPLGLWGMLGLARAAGKGDRWRSFSVDLPVSALAIALSFLGGHVEIAFYATFAIALVATYLVARLFFEGHRAASGRFLLAAGFSIGLGILVASVQLAPFLEVLQTNNRQGDTTYRQVISYALPRRQIFGLLMPDFFGNPAIHDYLDLTTLRPRAILRNGLGEPNDNPSWGIKNYVEAAGYVGVVPILLAGLAVFRGRLRERWFFVGLAALSILLAFGTPLYALIYYGLPFFSQLRTPFRWLYLLDFSMAVLAGMGMDAVVRKQEPGVRSQNRSANSVEPPTGRMGGRSSGFLTPDSWLLFPSFPVLAHWFPALVGFTGLAALAISYHFRYLSIAYVGQVLARSPTLQRAFVSGAMLYSFEFRNLALFFGILFAGGCLIGLLLTPGGSVRARQAAAIALATLIVGDLFYFGTQFATKSPASILDQHLDLTSVVRPGPAGPRVASLGDPYVLSANLGTVLDIPTVGGYDTIISAGFVHVWSLVEAPVDLPYNQVGRLHRLDSLGSPILDLLGVRYVLAEVGADHPSARLAGQIGPIRIYERPSALPRAFVVGQAIGVPSADEALRVMRRLDFRPGEVVYLEGDVSSERPGHGTATIQEYSLDRVVLSATADGVAWLVLADANAPGWNATVDGIPSPVRTADGIFRAVRLTAGTHQITFSYQPTSLLYGALGTIAGLVVLLLTATSAFWKRRIERRG
jgi:hypothetical protein